MEKSECGCGGGPVALKRKTKAKYDEQWTAQGEEASAERRRALSTVSDPLLAMVRPLDGKVVADLGIGTGCLAFRAMETSSPRVLIGLDFSSPGLCVARSISKTGKFSEMDCELVRADLESLPIKSRSVDVVLSQASLNLLPNKLDALKEISRIVKSGGRVAVSDAFKTRAGRSTDSWEQCIGGAVTVSEFSTLSLSAGLFIAGQVDLTQQVRSLVASKKWDWPEFAEHNMDYRGFLMVRS